MVNRQASSPCTEWQLAALAHVVAQWLHRHGQPTATLSRRHHWFYQQSIQRLTVLGRQLIATAAMDNRRNLSLTSNPQARSGLLLLKTGQSTPIHDHGNAAAFSLLLSGRARIDTFSRHQQQGTMALINMADSMTIVSGDGMWMHPRREPSLHRLVALEDDALFLDFQLPPAAPHQRLFYFVDHEVSSNRFQCNVLSEQALTVIANQKANRRSHHKCTLEDNL